MDRSNSILRYLKRKQPEENTASGSGIGSNINECQRDGGNEDESNVHSKSGDNGLNGSQFFREHEFDVSTLPMDPSLRKMISEYLPNLRDAVRRHYIANGPIQPPLQKKGHVSTLI